MRRLLVHLLLIGAAVLIGSSEVLAAPAQARACVPTTLQKQAQNAEAVFSAQVTGVERVGQEASYAVSVETVYKGAVHAQMTVRSAATGATALTNIVANRHYLFLGTLDGIVVQANACGGTKGLTAASTAAIVGILGEGSEPMGAEPTTPPAPVITRTDLDEPTSLSRLAAPGGALVLVGLFGLLLLRRPRAN